MQPSLVGAVWKTQVLLVRFLSGIHDGTRRRPSVSDPNRVKRDALVLTGGLLAFYAIVGILYAQYARSDDVACRDGAKIIISGICYFAWKLLAPAAVLGVVLVIIGLARFPNRSQLPQDILVPGTGTRFSLALLASLPAVTLLAIVVQSYRQTFYGTPFVIRFQGQDFEHVFLLQLLLVIFTLAFVPFLAAMIQQGRMRRRYLSVAVPEARGLEEPDFGVPATQPGGKPGEEALSTEEALSMNDAAWEKVVAAPEKPLTANRSASGSRTTLQTAQPPSGAARSEPPAHPESAPPAPEGVPSAEVPKPVESKQVESNWQDVPDAAEPTETEPAWQDVPVDQITPPRQPPAAPNPSVPPGVDASAAPLKPEPVAAPPESDIPPALERATESPAEQTGVDAALPATDDCAARTVTGSPCRNKAMAGSNYCYPHRNYKPPA